MGHGSVYGVGDGEVRGRVSLEGGLYFSLCLRTGYNFLCSSFYELHLTAPVCVLLLAGLLFIKTQ